MTYGPSMDGLEFDPVPPLLLARPRRLRSGGLPPHPPAHAPAPRWFEERTAAAGVAHPHTNRTFDNPYAHIMEGYTALGAAAAVADYDGDGWEDLFVTDSKEDGANRLYRNRGDFTFEEVGAAAGVAARQRRPRRQRRRPVVRPRGGRRPGPAGGALRAEPALRQPRRRHLPRRHPRGRPHRLPQLDHRPRLRRRRRRRPRPRCSATTSRRSTCSTPRPRTSSPRASRRRPTAAASPCLPTTASGRFTDATAAAGLAAFTGWTLDLGHADADWDGDEDLYVAADFGSDRFFRNDGDGTFTDATREAIGIDTKKGMNADWGDFDNDGLFDVFVTNITDEYMREGNFLWQNDGDGTFSDVARETGTWDTGWGWAGKFFDADNDGWLDLYVVNGWVSAGEGNYVLDIFELILERDPDLSDARKWPPMGDKSLSGYQHDALLHNLGGTLFEDVAAAARGRLAARRPRRGGGRLRPRRPPRPLRRQRQRAAAAVAQRGRDRQPLDRLRARRRGGEPAGDRRQGAGDRRRRVAGDLRRRRQRLRQPVEPPPPRRPRRGGEGRPGGDLVAGRHAAGARPGCRRTGCTACGRARRRRCRWRRRRGRDEGRREERREGGRTHGRTRRTAADARRSGRHAAKPGETCDERSADTARRTRGRQRGRAGSRSPPSRRPAVSGARRAGQALPATAARCRRRRPGPPPCRRRRRAPTPSPPPSTPWRRAPPRTPDDLRAGAEYRQRCIAEQAYDRCIAFFETPRRRASRLLRRAPQLGLRLRRQDPGRRRHHPGDPRRHRAQALHRGDGDRRDLARPLHPRQQLRLLAGDLRAHPARHRRPREGGGEVAGARRRRAALPRPRLRRPRRRLLAPRRPRHRAHLVAARPRPLPRRPGPGEAPRARRRGARRLPRTASTRSASGSTPA